MFFYASFCERDPASPVCKGRETRGSGQGVIHGLRGALFRGSGSRLGVSLAFEASVGVGFLFVLAFEVSVVTFFGC